MGEKLKKNVHALVNQFHGDFHSKTLTKLNVFTEI